MFSIPDSRLLWQSLKQWERREIAQDLRRLGLSFGEIRSLVAVSQSTLSGWCRGIDLTEEQLARIRSIGRNVETGERRAAGRRRAAASKRDALRDGARSEVPALIADPFWTAGLMAYWSEGNKRSNDVCLANSDPALVRLFITWCIRFLDSDLSSFTVQLHLHDGQNEDEARQFWSLMTGLDASQFRKTFFKVEGTGHRKNVLYNGTARVRLRASTRHFHRVMGWIDGVQELWGLLLHSDRVASSTGRAGAS